MIYWILGIVLIIAGIITYSFFKKRAARRALLAAIREKWGKPNDDARNIDLIGIYLRADENKDKISPATANDLDLDNVFAYIDRTNSRPGQQYLYKKLHHPQFDADLLKQQDKNVTALSNDRAELERIEVELSKLNTNEAYYLPELFVKEQSPLFNSLLTSYMQISWIIMIALIVLLIIRTNQFLRNSFNWPGFSQHCIPL